MIRTFGCRKAQTGIITSAQFQDSVSFQAHVSSLA